QFQKFRDALFAQAFDIQRTATDEVPQAFEFLRATDQAAGAADIHLALLRHRLAAAHRAMIREEIGRAILVAGQIFDYLGNDVAGALDDDTVARPHAQPADLVAVVQRDVRHHDAADRHRGQPSNGGQLAGAPDLDIDRFK